MVLKNMPSHGQIQDELVSTIIPVYNGEPYLAEAIESVLAQDYRPLELIVIDDGSTDETATVARHFTDVHYVYQANQGVSSALNHGIQLSKGGFISFLDADDYWLDGKLTLQIKVLNQHPELDMVFGRHQPFYNSRSHQHAEGDTLIEAHSLPGFFKGTALIRRDAFKHIGLFDTSLKMGDFVDWFTRAKDQGLSYKMLPQTVLMRRIHQDTLSQRNADHMKDYVHIIKASLDRRRQNNDDNKNDHKKSTGNLQ